MKFNSLIPELIVSDFNRSLNFYRDLIGFEVRYERPEERFAFLELGDIQLMLLADNDSQHSQHSKTGDLEYPRGQGINFSLRIDDLSRIAELLETAGISLRIPIRDQWHRQDDQLHGEKQLWVMDPDGYLLRFVQSLGTRPVGGD